MKARLITILILFLFLACDSDTNMGNTDKLLGSWELKSILHEGDIVVWIPSKVTLAFSQESKPIVFNGSATCNFYGGEIRKFNSKTIDLSNLFSTEMACSPDHLNIFENDYYKWLGRVTHYEINETTLVLSYDNTWLTFEKE